MTRCLSNVWVLQELSRICGNSLGSELLASTIVYVTLHYPPYRQWGQSSNKSSSKQAKPTGHFPGLLQPALLLQPWMMLPLPHQAHPESCSQSYLSKCPLQPQTVGFPEYQQPNSPLLRMTLASAHCSPTSELSKVLQRPMSQAASAIICCSLRHPWSPACWITQPVPVEESASQTSRGPQALHRPTSADLLKHPTHIIYTEVTPTQGHSLKTGEIAVWSNS